MNRVFKSIWNTTTGSWVAVSELGKSQGKKSSKNSLSLVALALAGTLGTLSMGSAQAGALDTNGSTSGLGTETTANWDLTTANINNDYSGNGAPTTWQQNGYLDIVNRPGNITITAAPDVLSYGIEAYGTTGNATIEGADLGFINDSGFLYTDANASLTINNNINTTNLQLYNATNNPIGITLGGQVNVAGELYIYNGDTNLFGNANIQKLSLNGYNMTTGGNTVNIKTVQTSGNITLGGDLVIEQQNGQDIYFSTTGLGRLIKEGANVITFYNVGDINHTGGTVVRGVDGQGGLRVTSDRGDNSGKVIGSIVLDGGNLHYNTTNGTGTIFSNDSITGVGRILHEGSGTLNIGNVSTSNNLDGMLGYNIYSFGGNLNLSNSIFSNSGNNASSVYFQALANSTAENSVANTTIDTTGDNSHGIEQYAAYTSSNELRVNNFTHVNTKGVGSDAVKISIGESSVNTIEVVNSTLTTEGEGSHGINFRAAGNNSTTNAIINASTISTMGAVSHGVLVQNPDNYSNVNTTATFINGNITATGIDSSAVKAIGAGSSVVIANSGLNSNAQTLLAENSGIISATNSVITANGTNSGGAMFAAGAYAKDGGKIELTDSTLITTSAQTPGFVVGSSTVGNTQGVLSNVSITTLGDGSHGVYVAGLGHTAIASLNNVGVKTSGAYAVAIGALGDASTVNASGFTPLATSGTGSDVVVAQGQGSSVNFKDASVSITEDTTTTNTLHAVNGGLITADNTLFSTYDSAKGITALAKGGTIKFMNGTQGVNSTLADNSGTVEFADSSALGTTLVSRNDGTTRLTGAVSTGGNTNVVLESGGVFDTIGATLPVRVTSLSGEGQVFIGAQTLLLGSNVNDTLVGDITSGILSYPVAALGAPVGATSADGGIVKVGQGVFTMAGSGSLYFGETVVAEGTLRSTVANNLSSYSNHQVLAGATLDIGGASQNLIGLENAGTVSLLSATPGTELTVRGAYVGNNGTLRLGATLGDNTTITDKLVLDGVNASASGHTNIQVVNQNGLGALTTGDGIEIVAARNGATTTAQTTKDAFSLQGGTVAAGAYEYRLKPGATNESWYLASHTEVVVPPVVEPTPETSVEPGTPATPPISTPTPTTPTVVEVPTYRAEVPMIAALPSQVHQSNLAMLGSMRIRQGDNGTRKSAPVSTAKADSNDTVAVELAAATKGAERQAWGRAITADMKLGQGGTLNPSSDGSVNGFQAGTDIWVSPAADWKVGAYFGQLNGKVRVNGFSSGIANNYSGNTDLKSKFFGAYATYQNADSLYVDTVLQYSRHDNTLKTVAGNNVSSKADGILASVEVGKSFPVSENWSLEPQAQLIYEKNSFDDIKLGTTTVSTDSEGTFTGRVGLRLKGDINTTNGLVQPYGRVSLYKSSNSNSTSTYSNAAANTTLGTPNGTSYSEVAVGAVWNIQPTVALYGEVSQLNRIGGSSATRSATQGSVGVKVSW